MTESLASFRQRGGTESGEGRSGKRWVAVAVTVVFLLALTLILSADELLPNGSSLANLNVGDVVEENIYSPRDITYDSPTLTSRAQQAAVSGVQPYFEAPDPSIARVQLDLARQILDYVGSVRFDPYASRSQKLADLDAISAITLDPETARYLLDVDSSEWRSLDAEIISVLERVIREPIREANVESLRAQLPLEVSLRLSERASSAAVAIIAALIRPNQFENSAQTEQLRQQAFAAVPPQTRSFVQGQLIVSSGSRLTALDYETLQVLELLRPTDARIETLMGAFLISVLVATSLVTYLVRFQPDLRGQLPTLALFGGMFLIAVLGAQVFTGDNEFYLYPAAGLSLLLVSLARPEIAIIAGMALAVLFGILTGGSLEATTMAAFGSLVGASSLRRTERVNTYFIAGLMIAVVNIAVLVIFNLSVIASGDSGRLVILILLSVINGLFAAAAALAGMYLVTLLFNLPTSFKLVELSQPSQPLLQRLLREAPGTYQHSLQVANLSEQAANAIGANAQLVRVAALYHDIGKVLNPAFFVENQAEGVNPHEQLNDPYRSADIIIQHVVDGDKLARQYRLPARIRDFIFEHHGTTMVSYFYRQAYDRAEQPDNVDTSQFRYPGPRPQSRETAILMLADTVESTVRARKPTSRAAIVEIVDEMFDQRTRDSQLDDSGLTSRHIKAVRAVFIEMLQAVYHPRINYPAPPPTRREGERRTEDKVPRLAPTPKAPSQRANDGVLPVASAFEPEPDVPLPEVPPLRRSTKPNPPNERADDAPEPEELNPDGV